MDRGWHGSGLVSAPASHCRSDTGCDIEVAVCRAAWHGRTPDAATLVARSVRPHPDWFFAHRSLAARAGQPFYLRVRPENPEEEAS